MCPLLTESPGRGWGNGGPLGEQAQPGPRGPGRQGGPGLQPLLDEVTPRPLPATGCWCALGLQSRSRALSCGARVCWDSRAGLALLPGPLAVGAALEPPPWHRGRRGTVGADPAPLVFAVRMAARRPQALSRGAGQGHRPREPPVSGHPGQPRGAAGPDQPENLTRYVPRSPPATHMSLGDTAAAPAGFWWLGPGRCGAQRPGPAQV